MLLGQLERLSSMMQNQHPLKFYEWLTLAFFLTLFLAIFIRAATTYHPQIRVEKEQVFHSFNVTITGEVAYPGEYCFYSGDSVEKALEMAVALPTSDLSKIKLKNKLKPGQKLRISRRKREKKQKTEERVE